MSENDTQELVAKFQKNSAEKVRVALCRFRGRMLVDLRIYFETDDGNYLPTKKGVAISPELWDHFRAAIEAVESKLEERGLWAPVALSGDNE